MLKIFKTKRRCTWSQRERYQGKTLGDRNTKHKEIITEKNTMDSTTETKIATRRRHRQRKE